MLVTPVVTCVRVRACTMLVTPLVYRHICILPQCLHYFFELHQALRLLHEGIGSNSTDILPQHPALILQAWFPSGTMFNV